MSYSSGEWVWTNAFIARARVARAPCDGAHQSRSSKQSHDTIIMPSMLITPKCVRSQIATYSLASPTLAETNHGNCRPFTIFAYKSQNIVHAKRALSSKRKHLKPRYIISGELRTLMQSNYIVENPEPYCSRQTSGEPRTGKCSQTIIVENPEPYCSRSSREPSIYPKFSVRIIFYGIIINNCGQCL